MEETSQKIYFELEVTWDGGVNGYYSFDMMMEDTIHSVFAVRSLNDLILDARKHSVTDNIILCRSYSNDPLDQEEIANWNDYIKRERRKKEEDDE